MLVLSRKTGEQVVLPSCGVTIEVVKIAGNKVRLGVQAPPKTGVHRREIWERISNRQGTCMESPPTNAANGSPPADGPTTPAASGEADVCRRLARRINQRTGGCILSLSVDSVDGRIVVSGRASTPASWLARPQWSCSAGTWETTTCISTSMWFRPRPSTEEVDQP